MALLYSLTVSTEFINIDGIAGTEKAGVSYSLKKSQIVRTKKVGEAMVIEMDNAITYELVYTQTKNPTTGVAFVSIDALETFLEGAIGTSSTSYGSTFSSVKTTLGLVATQLLPNAKSGWVTIKAGAANASTITIGPSAVVAGSGLELAAGESITIEHSDLSQIYVISGVNGMIVYTLGSYAV